MYEHLVAAKKGELEMLSTSLENDVGKVGNLKVQFVQSTHTIKATGSSLKEDLAFSDKLAHMCKEKVADWEERSKLRSEELLALSETIAALGNDDSLDLLKKTLSPDRSSLMQMQVIMIDDNTSQHDTVTSVHVQAASARAGKSTG